MRSVKFIMRSVQFIMRSVQFITMSVQFMTRSVQFMIRSVYDEDCLNHHVVLGRSASVTWTVHRVPSARAPPESRRT